MATKTFSGITNWGEATAELKIEVELTEGEVTTMSAEVTGVYGDRVVTGTVGDGK